MTTAMEKGFRAGFNFAQYLIELNAGHPSKIAYFDDFGSLSYGELSTRIRPLCWISASGAQERVLLLMQDNADWPVCFLGSLSIKPEDRLCGNPIRKWITPAVSITI